MRKKVCRVGSRVGAERCELALIPRGEATPAAKFLRPRLLRPSRQRQRQRQKHVATNTGVVMSTVWLGLSRSVYPALQSCAGENAPKACRAGRGIAARGRSYLRVIDQVDNFTCRCADVSPTVLLRAELFDAAVRHDVGVMVGTLWQYREDKPCVRAYAPCVRMRDLRTDVHAGIHPHGAASPKLASEHERACVDKHSPAVTFEVPSKPPMNE